MSPTFRNTYNSKIHVRIAKTVVNCSRIHVSKFWYQIKACLEACEKNPYQNVYYEAVYSLGRAIKMTLVHNNDDPGYDFWEQ